MSTKKMWAVAYTNELKNEVVVYPKLFSTQQEAISFGKEYCGNNYSVNYVIIPNNNEVKKQSHFTLNGDMANEFNETYYANIDDVEYDDDMFYKL